MRNGSLCIFDLDGTLYETASSFLPTMRRVYDESGVPSPGDEEILAMVGETYITFLEWLVPQGFSEGVQQIGRRITAIERDSIRAQGRLYPGIHETLAALHDRGSRIALCTNGDRRYATHVLETFDLLPSFDALKTNEEDRATKSELIAELLADFRPERTFVVGDRYHDIVAGRANGCITVGAAYGYARAGELAPAAHVIDTFPALLRIVDDPTR